MYVRERLGITLVIWVLLSVVAIAGMDMGDGNVVPVVMFMAMGAAAATIAIWTASLNAQGTESEKVKRAGRSRVGRLLDDLDDDELDELRARLETSTTLEEMLSRRDG